MVGPLGTNTEETGLLVNENSMCGEVPVGLRGEEKIQLLVGISGARPSGASLPCR